MKITANVLKDIMSSFPPAPPERGGIIGGKNGIVSVFCYDNAGPSEQAVYIPDTVYLNSVIKEWYRSGISFFGMIHSHLRNEPSLSTGDIQYIEAIMSGMKPGEKLYFPIVLPDCVIPYIAIKTETSVNIKQDVLNVHSE
jgi:proteasome lid subunit RPN8/RPN11